MGTTYNIKIVTDNKLNSVELKASIDSILVVFNKQMSTWDPKSEISTFNRWNSLDSFKVSKYFYDVVKEANPGGASFHKGGGGVAILTLSITLLPSAGWFAIE